MQLGIKNIVWIASYPKSGNTWFRVFLQNVITDSQKPININDLSHSHIASDRKMFNKYSGTNSSDLTDDEILNLRPEVYKCLAEEASNIKYIKVHDAWELNSLNRPIFPKEVTKAVLYIIRNPLEISISFAHHSSIPIKKSIERINNSSFGLCLNHNKLYPQLPQRLLSWSEHVISWTEESKLPIMVIRFEDMLDDPYNTFNNALKFINLEFSEDRINRAINNSKFEILRFQEQTEGFREKALNAKSFFRDGNNKTWIDLLSEEDKMSVLEHNYTLMERYDYLL